MIKLNTNTIKPLMAISVIATLLIAAMGTTANNMNASAFNFGLKSKDVNSGSIDTNSLFSCTGAAINCINTNQNNNNEIANNTAAVGNGNGNGNGNGILTCEECLSELLTPEQQSEFLLELSILLQIRITDLAQACVALDGLTEVQVIALLAILQDEVGLTLEAALGLLACLEIEVPPVIIR